MITGKSSALVEGTRSLEISKRCLKMGRTSFLIRVTLFLDTFSSRELSLYGGGFHGV